MIIIPIKEGEAIERGLKRFKKKYEKTGVLRQLRERKQFIKPSMVNRKMKLAAIYKRQMQEMEM